MNTKNTLILLSFAISCFVSCKKEDTEPAPDAIIYPSTSSQFYSDSIYFAPNILAMPDSTDLSMYPSYYALGAELGEEAELKVILTNLSTPDTINGQTPVWSYNIAHNVGWIAFNYSGDLFNLGDQRFISIQSGKIDIELVLDGLANGATGAFRMDVYENGSSNITFSRHFTWH